MFRYSYLLALLVAFSFFACEKSAEELPAPETETLGPSHEPSASASITVASLDPVVASTPSATARLTGLNRNWIGRWRVVGLTAYSEIAGRFFEGPSHGRDIQLDVKEDGRLLFWLQEYSHNAPGDVACCSIAARLNTQASELVMREEKSSCSDRQLLARDRVARIYLVSPCILKIETSPALAGMSDLAVIRAGCAKSDKAYPNPGL